VTSLVYCPENIFLLSSSLNSRINYYCSKAPELSVLIELHYLPCISYFALAFREKSLLIEKHEYFVKQSYRNRCYINTEHGRHSLNVPLTNKHGKRLITDVQIDHTQKWVNNHWRTIVSAYANAPFFEYYSDDLEKALYRKQTFLYDFNVELLTMCLKWLSAKISVSETQEYRKPEELSNYTDILDYRGMITPKDERYQSKLYNPVPYQQVFGNAFVQNTSLIDLIFCAGPEAGRIVRASSRENEQLQN
jgi:hypothetical protein